ncbi:class I SAM-dependent methyltransferase [Pelagibius sp.]|uniref:class I SAM-dependent methyltransferase n=1 Tax=Pelagibius sp. TaxID=1931238 RepID=UPI003B50FE37
MSRLDSFIRRLQAQRACIDAAVDLVTSLPGPVFELGLGNGRTYDHLRTRCPDREVFVFERKVAAHPDCIPDADHLFEGPLEDTLEAAVARFPNQVALIHADLGSGRPDQDARLSAFVARQLPLLLAGGGVVASDQDVVWPQAEIMALPEGVRPGRYYLFRKE